MLYPCCDRRGSEEKEEEYEATNTSVQLYACIAMLRLADETGGIFGLTVCSFGAELVVSRRAGDRSMLSTSEEPLSSYPELRMVGNLGF